MSASGTKPLSELERIQSIEEKVIRCIELAAAATEQLSSIGNIDKSSVSSTCLAFLENIKQCQALVQEVLSNPITNRSFEASSYHAQARAQIAAEKVRTVAGCLADMNQVLSRRATERALTQGDVHMDSNGP